MSNDDNNFSVVLGTTGKGISQVLSEVPIKLRKEYMNERNAEHARKAQEEKEQERLRNIAIKQAYIDHDGDLSFIDSLVKASDLTSYDSAISKDKLIQILHLLDDHIFFHGLYWNFEDTEVRSELYEWLDENLEPVRAILA